MSKHNTTPRTLSRRLVALLAALALLAAMALPVYAEAQTKAPVQTEPPVQTQETVEQDNNADTSTDADPDNKSETDKGTDTGADTDSDDTDDNASPTPGANSTTPAGDTVPSTGTTQPSSTDNTAPPAAGEDKKAAGPAEDENNTEEDENNTEDETVDSTIDSAPPANDSDTNSDDTTTTENGTRKIYYDATFSKLSLVDGKAIPNGVGGNVYCYMYKGDNTSGGSMKQMNRLSNDSDVYYVNAEEGYDHIIFASYDNINANSISWEGCSTAALEIPSTYNQPCFYADTGDASVFKGTASNNQRDGYWAELGTLRNAEQYKDKTVVNVPKSTFAAESGTKYINTTLYDYYSDWELNGNNRDSYDKFNTPGDNNNKFASNRNWIAFGQFDQALSAYYTAYNSNSTSTEKKSVAYPMYTGQFQPEAVGDDGKEWGLRFNDIAYKLNLYGYNETDKNKFMAINNSTIDADGKGLNGNEPKYYAYAFQGLTSATRVNGEPVLYDTSLPVPYFNRDFLLKTNSKNAKLGEVYDNVSFPFTKEKVFKDSNEASVDYWHFDSNETTLYLKQDTGNNGYFLQKSEDKRNSSRNLKSDSEYQDNESYGFFPFNEDSTNKQASTYNYGFGAKLEIPFTLTDDGQVYGTDGTTRVPIKFFFSGDDDVWVYIDEELALDVGGDHGKASGLLEFGLNENGELSYTPYVSNVKTSNKDKGVMYETFNGSKSVQYLNENNTITFNYKGTEKTLSTGTHTLTMYYMERGMWESNMAVAFNFPDHNELQVKKEVNVDGVNALFKSCFTNKRLFNFTIRNQATHYGTYATAGDTVTTINLLQPDKSTSDKRDFTPTVPTTTGKDVENRFTKVTSPPNDLNVTDGTPLLNWYTEFEDLTPSPGSNRDKRYGILTLGDNQTIDISGMSYLSFDIYVDSTAGDAALSNMYLELLDSSGKQKGCLDQTFIGGKDLYGQVEMHNKHWITVKLSLDDVKEQDGFDESRVKELRFGCNYPRSIYLRNIVFSSKAVPQQVTGFTTKQEKIADYGSAEKGTLMPAVKAQYTSDAEKGTMVVDGNGGFVLKDGETISFKDQFRRGSYLSINEQVDTNLFDTQWTIYENEQAVETTKAGEKTKLTLDGNPISLKDRSGTAPDDGRIERQDAEGNTQENNRYNGTKPSENNANDKTIVFRSYANPDAKDVDGETKLKVVFVNTVKTGSLTINKVQDANSATLKGPYKFIVRFTNVGGHALEDKAIEKECTVKVDVPYVIDNIPVGTRFTIQEVTPEDGSKLMDASVAGGGSDTTVLDDNTVRGSIVKGAVGEDNQAVATFTNTKQDLLDITGTKVWKDANGELVTSNLPDIYVQIQRRHEKTEEAWQSVPYQNKNYLPVENSYDGMTFSFLGLPAKDYSETDTPNFEYQVVEGYLDNEGVFHAVGDNGTIKIDEKVYGVAYKVSNTAATNNSNAKQTVTIINKQQDPKFTLDITKADAEDTTRKLAGVEFKLERLTDSTGNTGVDSSSFAERTGVTNGNGELIWNNNGTNVKGFTELKAGTYRLTETKAAGNYNLLSAPIIITFTKGGQYRIGDGTLTSAANDTIFTGDAVNGYTLNLTVLNRKTPTLPHTGADAPSLWLLIGLPLAVAGLLILVFRYNKKGGRQR